MQLIEKITDRIVYGTDEDWAMNIQKFDWVPGVGLVGILKAYEVTGKKEYLDFLIRWAKVHGSEAYSQKTVNSTAPLITILELYRITGEKAYGKICSDIAEYILHEAPMTVDGGLEHTVTEDASFSDQMWADTLFMVCIFMARYGRMTGMPQYSDFAVNQLKLHYRYLWDEEKHLFYHGWDGKNRNHLSGICWGRANAWIICSTVEILDAVPEFEGREEIICRLRKHAEGLARCQRKDGLFSTILDDPDSYEELSASAGIACGILRGIKAGYVDQGERETALKACGQFSRYISDSGEVLGVSGGTPIMENAQAYRDIPRMATLYGQALMCLALAESV